MSLRTSVRRFNSHYLTYLFLILVICVLDQILAGHVIWAMDHNADVQPQEHRIHYHIEFIEPQWQIKITANGLNHNPGRVALELTDFGSWTDLADYYLTRLTSIPPVKPDPENPSRWIVEAPANWDGNLRVEYALHAGAEGTSIQRAHALLPVRSKSYTYGCTANTLMRVLVESSDEKKIWTELQSQRWVRITPPKGWAVFSGWAGESAGPQEFQLDARDRNGLIMMGTFRSSANMKAKGTSIEVRQFGSGPPSASKVAKWIARLAPLLVETTRINPGPIRVFLTDSTSGGMMTDRGLMVAIPKTWSAAEVDLFSTRHTIAHELYHAWLGGMLRPPEDMIWFLEGFTDYQSLWHAAAAGIVPQEWFVQRLMELSDIAKRSSLGRISFIDKGINWRDDNGPNEMMAYTGAHIVAFAIDVELRKRGCEEGLHALLADLLRTDHRKCGVADVRSWFAANKAMDLWEKYIAGRTIPDVKRLLTSIGCKEEFAPMDLTYLGIRAQPADPKQPQRNLRIVELDLAGPAARAGAKVGDVITGWYPARSEKVEIGPEVKTPFLFGLTSFAPRKPGAYIGVVRGTTEHKLNIVPKVIKGGRLLKMTPGSEFGTFLKRPVRNSPPPESSAARSRLWRQSASSAHFVLFLPSTYRSSHARSHSIFARRLA